MLFNKINKKISIDYFVLIGALFLVLVFLGFNSDYKKTTTSGDTTNNAANLTANLNVNLREIVAPSGGVVIPVKWGNLGRQLVEAGVIDLEKFKSIYQQRGGLTEEELRFLSGNDIEEIKINKENSGFLLNLFWALGLSNKNEILANGPMKKYGDTENFASTGGWTIAAGSTMEHYSKYNFINLTPEQQEMVERVSQNIYRPCCDNSTYFPDCNHGMAMLGFLELMASQGLGEQELYDYALVLNSYWFTDSYVTIAKYFQNKNIAWENISSREILGKDFSSGSGYRNILKYVEPEVDQNGGSCAV